jgi:hypothetical protein
MRNNKANPCRFSHKFLIFGSVVEAKDDRAHSNVKKLFSIY